VATSYEIDELTLVLAAALTVPSVLGPPPVFHTSLGVGTTTPVHPEVRRQPLRGIGS